MNRWNKIGLELVIVKQLWWIHGAHYSSLCTCVYVGNFPKQRLKNIKNKSEEIIKRGGLPKYCIGGEKPVNSPRAWTYMRNTIPLMKGTQ